jgi:hypothetical protein
MKKCGSIREQQLEREMPTCNFQRNDKDQPIRNGFVRGKTSEQATDQLIARSKEKEKGSETKKKWGKANYRAQTTAQKSS